MEGGSSVSAQCQIATLFRVFEAFIRHNLPLNVIAVRKDERARKGGLTLVNYNRRITKVGKDL